MKTKKPDAHEMVIVVPLQEYAQAQPPRAEVEALLLGEYQLLGLQAHLLEEQTSGQ